MRRCGGLRRRSRPRFSSGAALALLAGLFLLGLFRRVVALLERGAENIAQRSAGIGGAVLGDGFLLLRHFQRLDRNAELARLAVELGDASVNLLAHREALRVLIGALARELVALDERGHVGIDNL